MAVDELYGNGSDPVPLGEDLFRASIGSGVVPALSDLEDRLQALGGGDPAPPLRLGATRGRFTAEEQTVNLRVSYGLLGRLTIGASVPFVRRRVESLLRLVPEGANVGTNPSFSDPGVVGAFRNESTTALAALQTAVDAFCTEFGETDAECVSGRGLITETDAFLDQLGAAYDTEPLFPLEGTSLGNDVSARWMGILTGFSGWETDAPDVVPLATDPIDDAAFRTLVLDAAWPEEGFPNASQNAFMALGDVELVGALALLDADAEAVDGPGVAIRATLHGGVRFPTGQPDSLRAVAPLSPPRGVGGFSLGLATDLLLSSRFAVLVTASNTWNGTRDMELLAPDPSGFYTPGLERADVEWNPGNQLSVGVAPRFHFGPPLSVGAGWQYVRQDADEFTAQGDTGGTLPEPEGPFTVQRVHLEVRYTATAGALANLVRLPFEAYLRGSRTVSGSGDWAPVERRLDAGLRFLIRR